ncbi:hypothetical protein [Roseicyclus mahoneyensis]|jgi:hypothetical protein|uniref:Protein phosphatase 2C-like protein n=1 Tax=Roseicyclus mahoneyensis TaxID=164332 RepID=A0A316GKI4_9RHOB|nr:hypothetical protein [Roseicyclus mahoneyensis]PWK61443.1 hypothetical protein C7455_102131 [Roseicyclus mahoneyensis]
MTGWIFESLLLPKDDAAPAACEDRILVLPPDFAAVIDGATDITGQRFDGQTGGALAAEAISAAFAQAWSHTRQGGADPFASAEKALALADHAIAAVYHRFGLTEAAQDPARRFRAAFAVVSLRDGVWRGVGAGDCALRIDDGRPILRDHPAEPVFAAWRAAMIAEDPQKSEADIRTALLGGLAQADAAARRAVAPILTKVPGLGELALQAGLAGMRAAPPGDPLSFGVADGVGDMGHGFCWQVEAMADSVAALALWTDGWLLPAGQHVDGWIKAAMTVHLEDPQRTRRFSCLKGPTASGRHDDMGLVLINHCR